MNLEWIKDCAKELVERNADRGRSYDNSSDYLETAAAIQRHYLLWAVDELRESEAPRQPSPADELLMRVLSRAVSSVPNTDPELMGDIGQYLQSRGQPEPAKD